MERTLNLRDSHTSSFFDVKQFVRQIQENVLSIKAFCHRPAVGQCLAVVWEQGMGQMPSALMWGTATAEQKEQDCTTSHDSSKQNRV